MRQAAGSTRLEEWFQELSTEGRNWMFSSRWFSKRKIWALGMEEETDRRRGTWSEVVLVQEERVEFRKMSFQPWLMKTLSSFAKIGKSYLLDQVYNLSGRGSSKRERELMVWLKSLARAGAKLSEFLSEGFLRRLKSPRINLGPEIRESMSESSSRKSCLLSRSEGP